jgi:hypothetical protein
MTEAIETHKTEMKTKWTIRLERAARWLALGLVVAALVHLDSIDHHATRLILRSRGTQAESFAAMLFGRLVFDPVHFVMERKMMLGIKQRAENAR